MLFLKAQIKGAHTPDLFATPVQVAGHVASGHVVGPYIAIRHKAPPEVSHPKAVVVPAHKPEPAPVFGVWRVSPEHTEAIIGRLIADHAKDLSDAELERILSPTVGGPALTKMAQHLRDTGALTPAMIPYQAPDPGPPMVVTTMPAVDLKAEALRKVQAKKLREAADKIIAGGEDSLSRDRQSNTRKRAGQAASAIQDAQKEIQLGETMRNLAAAVESGDARLLAGITSRAGLEMLVGKLRGAMYLAERGLPYAEQQRREGRPATIEDIAFAKMPTLTVHRSNISDLVYELQRVDKMRAQNPGLVTELNAIHAASGDNDMLLPIPEDLANRVIASFDSAGQSHAGWQMRDSLADIRRYRKMGIATDEQLRDALTELLEYRTGKRAEDPIKAAERALVGTKPGIDFFPTPPPLALRMVQLANIKPGEQVLEPSAGKGDIADAIRAGGGRVDVVELSNTLRKVLEAKGHELVGTDFEAFESHEQYDAIVMNPPWSGGADVRHVMRAYAMLKPGGRLVALMSMHASFANDKASQAFRGWMEGLGASSEKIPAADFASQWMSGGIPSWLVHLEKPMAKALFFKATIKGANTGDLFAEPVHVKAYVREGHTVQAHTEVRQVRHEAPPAPKPVIITEPLPPGPKTAEERREQLIVRGQARAARGRHYDTMLTTTPTNDELIRQRDEVRQRLAKERSEPDHLADGRKILDRYKDRLAARAARGLEGMGGSANDEKSMELWEARLSADPAKWQPGMGVSYQVSGGARMQTNRGFRIASIDVPGKRAVLRQVADTGMTSSGGDNDRFEDSYVYLGELKRDKKYDVPVPVVSKPVVDTAPDRRQDATQVAGAGTMDTSTFIGRLVKIGGKEWSSADGSKRRVYFDVAPLLGWEYQTYGTGNISWAKLKGEVISNSKARQRLGSLEQKKLWFDAQTGEVGTRDVSDDEKEEALAALNTKFWAGEPVGENPGFATLYRRSAA